VNNNLLILLSPILILILKRIGVLLHILLLLPTRAPPCPLALIITPLRLCARSAVVIFVVLVILALIHVPDHLQRLEPCRDILKSKGPSIYTI
jgi:hypothetical protein